MTLTDERIFELISEHTTYELQGPDEDDFGVPTVMNKWGHTMYASRFIDLARAIEAELEKQAPRWPIHEATHTMCLAGFDAIKNVPRGCTRRAHMRAVWAAMYAAMPAPPAAQGGEEPT